MPPLHLVSDDRVLARPDLVPRAREALAAGGGHLVFHLRGPTTSGNRLHALAEELLPHARDAGALLLVNDRVDVALALPLDGVHLGRRSLPVAQARALLGERLLGRSVHGAAAAGRAEADGADYLVVGTVFATSSHPGREPSGPDGVRRVRAACRLPLIAIGGVRTPRVADVVRAGARGVAVLSGVWDTPEPAAAVQGYLEALRGVDSPARPGHPVETPP